MADEALRPPRLVPIGRATAAARLGVALLAGAALLAGCGDTLQDKPVSNAELQGLLEAPRPVYWLGSSFRGMQLMALSADPGGAYTLQYGNCFVGGQEACLTPLEVITSPESTFLAGNGLRGAKRTTIRDAKSLVAQNGQVVEVATGPVVVEVRSRKRSIGLAAAHAMVPINAPGEPGQTLPAAAPNSEYLENPLASQEPHPVLVLPPIPADSG